MANSPDGGGAIERGILHADDNVTVQVRLSQLATYCWLDNITDCFGLQSRITDVVC